MEKSKFIFVKKINKEHIVRDPLTGKPILDDGQYVVNDTYWRSKIDAGILEVVDQTVEPKVEPEVRYCSKKK